MGALNLTVRRLFLLIFSALRVVRELVGGGSRTSLHKARFAGMTDLRSLLLPELPKEGLLLADKYFQFVTLRPEAKRRELGNVLIVGPTRCGKGLLAVSQLLTFQHSVIVNDIKGDLFVQTAGYREKLGPVYVLDVTGVGHGFDPLADRNGEDQLFSAASQLLYDEHEGDGRVFTQRAISMLSCIFAAAKKEGAAPLPYTRLLVTSGLRKAAARLHRIDPSLAALFLYAEYTEADFDNRFLLSAWETLHAKIRPLLTETLVRCFTRSDFTAPEIIRAKSPVTVYLRLKEQDLLSLAPVVRLLWDSLINGLITTYDACLGQGCRPVLLLIDEAGRTAISSLADYSTTVAGRGITIEMIVQSLSQLEVVYGKAKAQTLKDNMDTQLYYPPIDLGTAKQIEERLGEHSAYARSTTVREGGAGESIGLSERPIPLLTAQEIMQMREEEVIGFYRHLPPFRVGRMDWRKYPLLRKRQQKNVPGLSELPGIPDFPEFLPEVSWPTGFIDPDEHVEDK